MIIMSHKSRKYCFRTMLAIWHWVNECNACCTNNWNDRGFSKSIDDLFPGCQDSPQACIYTAFRKEFAGIAPSVNVMSKVTNIKGNGKLDR